MHMMTAAVGSATPIALDPPPSQLNWTNAHGGPLVDRSDPISYLVPRSAPPHDATFYSPSAQPPPSHAAAPAYKFERYDGFLSAGDDLFALNVTSAKQATDACAASILCHGVTYESSGINGTVTHPTRAYFKRSAGFVKSGTWTTWLKHVDVDPPALTFAAGGLQAALRTRSLTVQWLNASRATKIANYSFVPALTPGSALPLVHHLGDLTLRVRTTTAHPAAADSTSSSSSSSSTSDSWAFFSSAWGPFSAEATPLTPQPDEYAAHDITPLLSATRVPGTPAAGAPCPLTVRRAYLHPSTEQPGLGIAFTLSNGGKIPIEIGGLGLSVPAATSQDVHLGGEHGWVEWMRVLISKELLVEGQCVLATPLSPASRLENLRPIFEYGGGGYEWSVHTKAWASEWERNVQWPYEYMDASLNATGLWPHPRSPWPSWGDGGQTVRTNVTRSTHWNAPTSKVLPPGANVTYGLRLLACDGGPRTRDDALVKAGEPLMRGVPGYTLATDMETAALYAAPSRPGLSLVSATSDDPTILTAGAPTPAAGRPPPPRADAGDGDGGDVAAALKWARVPVRGKARGRARVHLRWSDGTTSVAHYLVLPPLPTQIARVTAHWADVAWLPRTFVDPFGRSASVMPWDREDKRHRLDDGRAYDVGLSDDAGAANNLGLGTTQAYAPTAHAVSRVDEYIHSTLYGIKSDTAHPPYKSLQLPPPNNGVRMTLYYYDQTYFPYNYTERAQCGVVGGLNYNWCMTEKQANATYRGFNYPHQIATWYGMYRVARNHPKLKTLHPWEWYLEMAANTTIRLGWARIGYMDGTVTREVLRSVLEEAEETKRRRKTRAGPDEHTGPHAGGGTNWSALGDHITRGEKSRADYFVKAANPYGSEFSYDTTGQEEVVVWLLYFGHDAAANRTIDHILQYMRPLPNWAYNGGAQAGDVANGGKWLVTAGTGRGDSGKMHYRAGLNQIPLIEWYRRHPDDLTTLEIATSVYTLAPRDAYRQRVYLEPLGVYIQADSGTFDSVSLDMTKRTISVTFSPASRSPAKAQTYDVLRLRVDKTVVPPSARPGGHFRVVQPPKVPVRRAAFEIPPPPKAGDPLTVVIEYDEAADEAVADEPAEDEAAEDEAAADDDNQDEEKGGASSTASEEEKEVERAESSLPPLHNPCLGTLPFSAQPWCNATLPMAARLADMLSRMSIEEKLGSMDTDASAIPSLGLNRYNWWGEATHGISTAHVNASGPTPEATNFAMPITTVASFNRSLWHATGHAIAREARGFSNVGHGYSTFWAPVVNLAREPRWGRNLESAGEDPLLSGEYAVSFVTGFEHHPEDPGRLAASACCKHYVANSMEDSRVAGVHHTRYSADPTITDQDLVDSYMLPFQKCVEEGKVSSLMCSYNAVNGVPTCADKWLLDTVARDAWGFDGYIVSDCAAVGNVVAPHRYVKTSAEAVGVTLHAGMDMACAHFIKPHGPAALQQGLITEALLDRHLTNLFRVRMRLGHFDPPGPLERIPPSAICTDEHQSTAREGASQGAALFKNIKNTLPLDAAKLAHVAVIGPNAMLSKSMAGYYGPAKACGEAFPTLVDAIRSYCDSAGSGGGKNKCTVAHAAGVPSVLSDNVTGVPAAAALAKASDTTILVLGTDLGVARENHDAVELTYSAGQLALVAAVASASPSPIVVVTLTAVPLDLTPILSNPKVGAVLHAGQVSVQTFGVADVLFGTVSPAGRAVQTIYPATYQHQISPFDFGMRPGASRWPRPDSPGPCNDPYVTPVVPSANCTLGTNPGRTYRFYNGTAVVPFGHGLSYTSWAYKVVEAPTSASLAPLRALLARTAAQQGLGAASPRNNHHGRRRPTFPKLDEVTPAARYVINVSNVGGVDADDVVLGFLSPPGAGTHGRPRKSLFGFERVHVKAGETVSVVLYPKLLDLAETTLDGARVPLAGDYIVSFGVRPPGWLSASGGSAAGGKPDHGVRMGYAEAVLSAV